MRFDNSWFLKAINLLVQGNPDKSQDRSKKSLEKPSDVGLCFSDLILFGKACIAQKNYDSAYVSFEAALKLNHEDSVALFYMGLVRDNSGAYNEALNLYQESLALGPPRANLLTNMAVVNYKIGEVYAAESYYKQALALDDNHINACIGLATIMQADGRLDDALGLYDRALDNDPSNSAAAFHKSQILLGRNQFESGFKFFLARPNRLFSSNKKKYTSLFKEVLPGNLSGKVILVLGEQTGIGDDLFYARFFPELKSRGAQVFFKCGARVAELLATSNILDKCILGEEEVESDYVVFAGDLPLVLRMWENSLIPEPFKIDFETTALEHVSKCLLTYPRPYIGLTWRAGTQDQGKDPRRPWSVLSKTVPADLLGDSLRDMNGSFFVLQRTVAGSEVDELQRHLGKVVVDLSGFVSDLKTVSAVLALMDDYICVPNSHMHLSLAVLKPCHILSPSPPDWRLMSDGDKSNWYPGCTIFRQDHGGSWEQGLNSLRKFFLNGRQNAGCGYGSGLEKLV